MGPATRNPNIMSLAIRKPVIMGLTARKPNTMGLITRKLNLMGLVTRKPNIMDMAARKLNLIGLTPRKPNLMSLVARNLNIMGLVARNLNLLDLNHISFKYNDKTYIINSEHPLTGGTFMDISVEPRCAAEIMKRRHIITHYSLLDSTMIIYNNKKGRKIYKKNYGKYL
uniref:Ribosomal_L30 domain-containing protein n=1 Tax=Strongyloides papillosus TaxID=174720 RepID=A0A0N5BYD6_STREA